MRLPSRQASLLLLLLPALAAAVTDSTNVAPREEANLPSAADAATKVRSDDTVAPVDRNDGKPHNGPWVKTDGKVDQSLPELQNRPEDPMVVDGKKIPQSNDGVMDDPTRKPPKEGTTGTEGGVSEKGKARKEQDGGATPEAPKDHPPLPHSEQEKIKATGDSDSGTSAENNRQKPYGSDSSKTSGSRVTDAATEDASGIIQPFHSFILSFTMILVSEVGDKTFLVAALMAMKHDRMVVFSAAFGALLIMTILSAVLGHAVPTLIPKRFTSFLAAGLFFIFGAKMLKEGMDMDPNEGVQEEMHEVERELAEREKEAGKHGNTVSPYALEMGVNGRTPRSKGRFPTPPRSPSMSPGRSPTRSPNSVLSFVQGLNNLLSLLLSPAWVQTFVMTFLGEWGDRSQIATIAMAAGQDYWWVILGATAGHCICTGVAVLGGRAIAGRVSLKVVTVGGAIAFLLFGFIYLFESFYA